MGSPLLVFPGSSDWVSCPWEYFIFQFCSADVDIEAHGEGGESGSNQRQDTYLCMLLIVHMGEEVKHSPTNGVAVFAPVIASIIILISSSGLIWLHSSQLEAFSRVGTSRIRLIIVYHWFLERERKLILTRNSRYIIHVLSQKLNKNMATWLEFWWLRLYKLGRNPKINQPQGSSKIYPKALSYYKE